MDPNVSPDEVAKKRIITHMNSEHGDSISRYLEHNLSLSSYSARSASLTDLTLSSLTIKSHSGTYTIPLQPPMSSYREARERLVAMDQAAVKALGRSPITVTHYTRPRSAFHVFVFASCLLGYFGFSRKANFEPGSLLWEAGLKWFPGFAAWMAPRAHWGLAAMVAIHGFETGLMVVTRLGKHSVPVGSGLWWKWVCSTFVEGICAFQRFDAIVAQKTKEAESKKH